MKNTILIFTFLLFAGIAQAGTFEIRLVDAGSGTMSVEVRETSGIGLPTSSGYVTDLVFGIRWPKSYSVDLDGATLTTSYKIAKSDVRKESGTYHYQAFYAKDTPYLFPTSWVKDTWVEIMRVTNTMTSTGTGCFEITPTAFHVTTDPNFGVNLSDFSPTITAGACVVLPLELAQFEANHFQKEKTLLTWTTASETNTENFDIQHSANAEDWTSIGLVLAAGNSQTALDYRFIDETPDKGTNYYRLKMNDIGEAFTYSPIRVLVFDGRATAEGITVSPNPTKGTPLVTLSQKGSGQLHLTSVNGQALKSWQLNGPEQIELTMDDLPSGLYLLTFEGKEGKFTRKVVKY